MPPQWGWPLRLCGLPGGEDWSGRRRRSPLAGGHAAGVTGAPGPLCTCGWCPTVLRAWWAAAGRLQHGVAGVDRRWGAQGQIARSPEPGRAAHSAMHHVSRGAGHVKAIVAEGSCIGGPGRVDRGRRPPHSNPTYPNFIGLGADRGFGCPTCDSPIRRPCCCPAPCAA